jgi:capsular polysaccharide export protein
MNHPPRHQLPRKAGEPGAFLFLQGPISPFFTNIGNGLALLGHAVHCINLSFGDQLFWRRPGATNYRGSLQNWPSFIEIFLDQHHITDLVLLGEQRDYHKQAIAAAKTRGIHVTVTDFGYLRPDWITLERDGMSGSSLFPRDPAVIKSLADRLPEADLSRKFHDSFLRMAIWDVVYHIANVLFMWLFPRYRTHKMQPLPLIYLGTGWRMLKEKLQRKRTQREIAALNENCPRYYVHPLQLAYDFQLRAYSNYPDQGDSIREVVTSFATNAPPDTHLIIKVHPMDTGLRDWRKLIRKIVATQGVADRVHYLEGGNLDQLCDTALGMVTINSTSGLRALQLDCPVKTLGQAIFDVPGLTFQGTLDAFWSEKALPEKPLRDAFVKLMASSIQIRGVFYSQPGLDAGVSAAVNRLHNVQVNTAWGVHQELIKLNETVS